jgi:hypothetical protein
MTTIVQLTQLCHRKGHFLLVWPIYEVLLDMAVKSGLYDSYFERVYADHEHDHYRKLSALELINEETTLFSSYLEDKYQKIDNNPRA